ncbi:MAG: alpha/beta hydrolase [Bacteroides sp.]|nr:alpha/beta hydrolase [Bacteroides sp.]
MGGYRAGKVNQPSVRDATGFALQQGYVVVVAGSRGSDSKVTTPSGEIYTGRAPAGLVDLKAAIRYLRHNAEVLPGNIERIITDGTSAGGAMSALLGSTGNHPVYEPYLRELGATPERDDIFAAVCFCPITDLDYANMAYEWLYNRTNRGVRDLTADEMAVSDQLAALYPFYLNGLELEKPDGTLLTDKNYLDYVTGFLIDSAQKGLDAGMEMPTNASLLFNERGDLVLDIEIDRYLAYVAGRQKLKAPPAFDSFGVLTSRPSPENSLFGDETGNAVNFTDYSLQKRTEDATAMIDDKLREMVRMMNPMNFIDDPQATKTSHWYIRHGAADRDTGFHVSVNLYTKLINRGYDVNYELAWDKGHTGDYDLDELFDWIDKIVQQAE